MGGLILSESLEGQRINNFTFFVGLFRRLPLLRRLEISRYVFKRCVAVGNDNPQTYRHSTNHNPLGFTFH